MKKSDFQYDLPPELIAQQPLSRRSDSRLLFVHAASHRFEDRRFVDLLDYLRAGDLLVFNDTRVLPARLFGQKETGGAVEILIERVTDSHEVIAQLGVSKKPRPQTRILLDDEIALTVLGREGEFHRLRSAADQPIEEILLQHGHMPLPPYIARSDDATDSERYQTVFARAPGAVAAPTAGLHFDTAMLGRLEHKGVDSAYVTLHVGAGTFQPMRVESIKDHVMHREWLNVGAELVEKIRRTRHNGGRVIAVGTTVVRALESALRDGRIEPFAGETQIFIFPGYRITSVDALLTNFHLPESTLLMLVSAFAGRELMLDAYRHAVEQRYRFFSYGDAMLILPHASNAAAGDAEKAT